VPEASFAAAAAFDADTRIPFVRGFDGVGFDLHSQIASGYRPGIHGLAAAALIQQWSPDTRGNDPTRRQLTTTHHKGQPGWSAAHAATVRQLAHGWSG
jgi:hypothetical protein